MRDLPSASNPAKPARVAVVAAGIVSPLGIGLEETIAGLREARDCVSQVTAFPVDRCRCQTAGQVPDARLAEANQLHDHPQRLHRVAQMMILALREAVAQAGNFQPELTVMGTTSGGMTFGEQYYR